MEKTFSAKTGEVERQWFIVDLKGQVLGRAAARIAAVLRGKHKPRFTPHIDTGDFVVVINADKAELSGKKAEQKMYYRHSGHLGHLKVRSLAKMIELKPTEVVRHAVKGMLPKTRLAKQQLTKLKVYASDKHPHEAQKPAPLDVGKARLA